MDAQLKTSKAGVRLVLLLLILNLFVGIVLSFKLDQQADRVSSLDAAFDVIATHQLALAAEVKKITRVEADLDEPTLDFVRGLNSQLGRTTVGSDVVEAARSRKPL